MVESVRASKELAVSTLVGNAIWPAEAASARASQRLVVDVLADDLGVSRLELPWLPNGVTSRGDLHELASRIEVGP